MYFDASSLDSVDELGSGVGDDDPVADPAAAVAATGVRVGSVARLRPQELQPVLTSSVLASRASSRVALHRRRQVFFALLLGMVVSLGVAAFLNSIVWWAVHGCLSLLFLGYVALLVRHHQRATEHAAKVRYLTPIRTPRPAVVVLHGTAR